MATMIERMLEQAEGLIEEYPGSNAARRRSISAAYYAAFHGLMELCADSILPNGDDTSEAYARIYRAIDHGPMKKAFLGPALRSESALRAIGDAIIELQSARMKADYLPASYSPDGFRLFTLTDARKYLAQSRRTIERLSALDDDDRLTLAIHLLFKDRPRD